MAESRCIGGRPTNALKRELIDIGANAWFEKNTDKTQELIERIPPIAKSQEALDLLKRGPVPGISSKYYN
jgi:hypothetical protein